MPRKTQTAAPAELGDDVRALLAAVARLRRLLDEAAPRLTDDDLSALLTPLFHLYSAPGNELYARRKERAPGLGPTTE